MTSENDGGPAFPRDESVRVPNPRFKNGDPPPAQVAQPDMTLRDWFAGMALANPNLVSAPNRTRAAEAAYALADAMLERRAEEP